METQIEKRKKKQIPQTLRFDVWVDYQGDRFYGKCFCCRCPISVKNFHAGHIISEELGGTTTQDNLRPICENCNHSMKTRNMFEFKRAHYPETCWECVKAWMGRMWKKYF